MASLEDGRPSKYGWLSHTIFSGVTSSPLRIPRPVGDRPEQRPGLRRQRGIGRRIHGKERSPAATAGGRHAKDGQAGQGGKANGGSPEGSTLCRQT
jgi:hypothetical protein